MWNSILELRALSAWLQWLSIALVFFSGFLQVGKYVVDRREKVLSAIQQAETAKPASQIIAVGSATIELETKSTDSINSHFMDKGAYIAFGEGSTALLVMRSIDCFGVQDGKGRVKWRAVVSLDALDPAIGKKVGFLSQAEYIQIEFGPMPEVAEVAGGKVIITLNSTVRFEVPIGEQITQDRRIFVRDLRPLKTALQ